MTATTDTPRAARTYGNWRKPQSPGLGPLGLGGTIVMFVGVVVSVFGLALNLVVGLTMMVVLALVLAPLTWRDRWGRTAYERVAGRARWRQHRRSKRHLYLSGPLSRTPDVSCRPPGLAARLEVSEALDAHGQPWVVLHHPRPGHVATVIDCTPPGTDLVDVHQIDAWVAGWGDWLANLGRAPGLVGAQVTVETAPDAGVRLRKAVQSRLRADAPALAAATLTEVVDAYPAGSSTTTVRVALTWSRADLAGSRRRTVDDMVVDIGARLPELCASLAFAGGGQARPMRAGQLAGQVRAAYDPEMADLLAEAGEEMSWADAGPLEAQGKDGAYWHDGAVSVSWVMGKAPETLVQSGVLVPLLKPHPEVPRKRVTMLYRPISDVHTPVTAQQDLDTALFRAQQRRVPRARAQLDVRKAENSAKEEASGAGMERFGMVVTATVPEANSDARRRCLTLVENLGRTARLQLRRVRWSQDSAFLAGLPLGLVLPAHLTVPKEWTEKL